MKLVFDGKVRQYHPATGLDLFPGEHDYPEDKTDELLALGLKKAKDVERAKARKASRKKAEKLAATITATEGSNANG